MNWVLVIIFGISGWGNGGYNEATFTNKEDCYEALSKIRVEAVGQISGEDDEQVIVYCKPENK